MDWILYLFHILLVVPMTNVLVATARIFGGNFGIAIIVFTLVMRFITWPLTASQYKQTGRCRRFQPQLQELQKKYKGKDPKKLQAETMALYKEAGVNPLGCIFPMLVQFPSGSPCTRSIRSALGETPESLSRSPAGSTRSRSSTTAVRSSISSCSGTSASPTRPLSCRSSWVSRMYVQQKMITPTPPAASRSSSSNSSRPSR